MARVRGRDLGAVFEACRARRRGLAAGALPRGAAARVRDDELRPRARRGAPRPEAGQRDGRVVRRGLRDGLGARARGGRRRGAPDGRAHGARGRRRGLAARDAAEREPGHRVLHGAGGRRPAVWPTADRRPTCTRSGPCSTSSSPGGRRTGPARATRRTRGARARARRGRPSRSRARARRAGRAGLDRRARHGPRAGRGATPTWPRWWPTCAHSSRTASCARTRAGPWRSSTSGSRATGAWRAALALALCAALGGLAAVAAVAARGRARLDVQADLFRLPYLEVEAERLWPEAPATIPAYEAWLSTADALVARLDVHRAALAELRGRALALDCRRARGVPRALAAGRRARRCRAPQSRTSRARAALAAGAELEGLEAERAALAARQSELERGLAAARPWRFERAADQLRHDALAETVHAPRSLRRPGARPRRRRAGAARVRARGRGAHAGRRRRGLGARRRARGRSPGGPTAGSRSRRSWGWSRWVPIPPRASRSSRWCAAASRPFAPRTARSRWTAPARWSWCSCPRGRFHLGAQAGDPAAPGFDAGARPEEGPGARARAGRFPDRQARADAGAMVPPGRRPAQRRRDRWRRPARPAPGRRA